MTTTDYVELVCSLLLSAIIAVQNTFGFCQTLGKPLLKLFIVCTAEGKFKNQETKRKMTNPGGPWRIGLTPQHPAQACSVKIHLLNEKKKRHRIRPRWDAMVDVTGTISGIVQMQCSFWLLSMLRAPCGQQHSAPVPKAMPQLRYNPKTSG